MLQRRTIISATFGVLAASTAGLVSLQVNSDTLSNAANVPAGTASALFAANSTWENFKRIKRGEDATEAAVQGNDTVTSSAQSSAAKSSAGTDSAVQSLPKEQPAEPVKKPQPDAAPQKQLTKKSQNKRQSDVSGGVAGKPNPALTKAPKKPAEVGSWWAFYQGTMKIAGDDYYDPHGIDYEWAYSLKKSLPENPRIVVYLHGSGGGKGAVMWAFGPSPKGDLEVRVQDAETYNQDWREWWAFGANGQTYPGRRIGAALEFVTHRYGIDTSKGGIVVEGPSMGGGGAVVQTMIMPEPWRSSIAYSSGRVGVIMPRRVAEKAPGQYASQPPNSRKNKALWDSIDFSIHAASDPVVRGIHYRHSFSTNDQFSEGPEGNTQTEFVNLIEQHKIGGAFAWVKAGHATNEKGVKLPDLANFEDKGQDITLDRAHPAFTNSSGNYPRMAKRRTDEVGFPRGHYNMGLIWNHAGIIDEKEQIVFPLKYQRRTGIGKGVPDQPLKITVNVTPRRPRHFQLNDGETLKWSWDGGALSGLATVKGDTVVIRKIPLVSHDEFRNLRIYR
ncbi:MAG: hypothetical protein ACI9JM_000022 [Halioglobus sp.]|jgi:hypothetical protein